jgi:hypothetical protein
MKPVLFVLCLAMGLAVAQNTPPPKGSISGVVTDTAGAPVAGVTVAISRAISTVTDSQGRFSLKDIEPGRRMVGASGMMGGIGTDSTRWVEVLPGQDVKVSFRIQLFGEVTGRVLDENKEPVPNIYVVPTVREYLLGEARLRYGGGAPARTDDRGVYRLQRVSPGQPFVLMAGHRTEKLDAPLAEVPADPKLRKRVAARTYYPDSPVFEGAEVLTLRSGEHREGIDIRLRKSLGFCMDGVLTAAGKPAVMQFTVIEPGPTSGARGGGGMYIVAPAGKTGPDGKFRVCGLYPGTYGIQANAPVSEPGAMASSFGTAEVTIKDEDVHNVRLAAVPKVSLAGEVVWDGPAPEKPIAAKLMLRLRPLTRAPWMGEGDLGPGVAIPGEFSVAGVFVDDYHAQITKLPTALYTLPGGVYVKDILYGTASVLHAPLRAGSQLGSTLRIVMGQDGGTIGVKVADKDGNTVPEINIYLVPASILSEALALEAAETGQTDAAGTFTSGTLAPGKYYALASAVKVDFTPESTAKLWRSRLRGKEVDLPKKGSVQLTLEPVGIE